MKIITLVVTGLVSLICLYGFSEDLKQTGQTEEYRPAEARVEAPDMVIAKRWIMPMNASL